MKLLSIAALSFMSFGTIQAFGGNFIDNEWKSCYNDINNLRNFSEQEWVDFTQEYMKCTNLAANPYDPNRDQNLLLARQCANTLLQEVCTQKVEALELEKAKADAIELARKEMEAKINSDISPEIKEEIKKLLDIHGKCLRRATRIAQVNKCFTDFKSDLLTFLGD